MNSQLLNCTEFHQFGFPDGRELLSVMVSLLTQQDAVNMAMAATVLDQKPIQPHVQSNGSFSRLIHAAAVNGDKLALQKFLKDPEHQLEEPDQFGRTPLMVTVLADHIECAQLLLKNGANVDAKDHRGRTALHWAAYKGIYRFCSLLISRGAYWREKDREDLTALHLVTKHENTRCLTLILKELFVGEVDEQDVDKRTALHWSASYGNLEAVRILINEGSNIGIPDVEGKTPLHWAATAGDTSSATATVQLILEAEPSVINWQDFEGRTALHLAVADGNTKTVETLIKFQTHLEKCNVSVLDNLFRTPLHWAAVLGHTHIVNLLLDKKASFSSSDGNGATALHYAAQNNHAETVEAFLSREDITDEPDMERRTALMWAAGKGADDVIHVMMGHHGDIDATDKIGATALHAAAMAGHTSTVGVLLKLGADVNVTDENKHTPLFRAAEMGQTEALVSLIEGGATVNVLDDEGRSPLHWAARGGHSCVCANLLKHEISPNVQDHHGRTPLQCAAYGGFINCMNILLLEGADPDLQDKEGVTALHYACSTGYLEAVRLLLEHGSFINHMEVNEDCFTPLDHALLNGHHEVVQFMIEQGALSINTIRDLAASRIQAIFRGYCVRKTFLERKLLLVKHEELRKHAAARKKECGQSSLEESSKDKSKGSKMTPSEADGSTPAEKEGEADTGRCETAGEDRDGEENELQQLLIDGAKGTETQPQSNMDELDTAIVHSANGVREKPLEIDSEIRELVCDVKCNSGKFDLTEETTDIASEITVQTDGKEYRVDEEEAGNGSRISFDLGKDPKQKLPESASLVEKVEAKAEYEVDGNTFKNDTEAKLKGQKEYQEFVESREREQDEDFKRRERSESETDVRKRVFFTEELSKSQDVTSYKSEVLETFKSVKKTGQIHESIDEVGGEGAADDHKGTSQTDRKESLEAATKINENARKSGSDDREIAGKENSKTRRRSRQKSDSINVNSLTSKENLHYTKKEELKKRKPKTEAEVENPPSSSSKSDPSKFGVMGERVLFAPLEKRNTLSRSVKQNEKAVYDGEQKNPLIDGEGIMRRPRARRTSLETKHIPSSKKRTEKDPASPSADKHDSFESVTKIQLELERKESRLERTLPSIQNKGASKRRVKSAQQRPPRGKVTVISPSRDRHGSWPSPSLKSEFDWRGRIIENATGLSNRPTSKNEKQQVKPTTSGQVRRQRSSSAVTMPTGHVQESKSFNLAPNKPSRRQKLHPSRIRSASNELLKENSISTKGLSKLPSSASEERGNLHVKETRLK